MSYVSTIDFLDTWCCLNLSGIVQVLYFCVVLPVVDDLVLMCFPVLQSPFASSVEE